MLEDFPEDAPYTDLGDPPEGLTCPVSFPVRSSEGSLGERLAAEVAQLQAWHELAVKHRGRTTLGVKDVVTMAAVPGHVADLLAVQRFRGLIVSEWIAEHVKMPGMATVR